MRVQRGRVGSALSGLERHALTIFVWQVTSLVLLVATGLIALPAQLVGLATATLGSLVRIVFDERSWRGVERRRSEISRSLAHAAARLLDEPLVTRGALAWGFRRGPPTSLRELGSEPRDAGAGFASTYEVWWRLLAEDLRDAGSAFATALAGPARDVPELEAGLAREVAKHIAEAVSLAAWMSNFHGETAWHEERNAADPLQMTERSRAAIESMGPTYAAFRTHVQSATSAAIQLAGQLRAEPPARPPLRA